MWYFRSPDIFFGDDALCALADLKGARAFIVTDKVIAGLGHVDLVREHLAIAGIESAVYADVTPEPTLANVRAGAGVLGQYEPDWIIGLGGGSCLDAARAMWILYERPDVDPEAINPFDDLGLRRKARLICIPTTAGTGSESGYAVVLTDPATKQKLTRGAPEARADITIVDPRLTAELPRQLTADTGIDVLSHAIEGYTSQWANDFTDGPCLKAISLVFRYLPRAVTRGAADARAREKMANAAALAGLALGNSNVALAHGLGHSAGALFPEVPHGRITAIFLPLTIEFAAHEAARRYQDIAYILGLPAADATAGVTSLVGAIRELMRSIRQPLSLREAGISQEAFDANFGALCALADSDHNLLMGPRIPDPGETARIFRYAFEGKPVDF
jgi:alcohol dehydrogenase class IV